MSNGLITRDLIPWSENSADRHTTLSISRGKGAGVTIGLGIGCVTRYMVASALRNGSCFCVSQDENGWCVVLNIFQCKLTSSFIQSSNTERETALLPWFNRCFPRMTSVESWFIYAGRSMAGHFQAPFLKLVISVPPKLPGHHLRPACLRLFLFLSKPSRFNECPDLEPQ